MPLSSNCGNLHLFLCVSRPLNWKAERNLKEEEIIISMLDYIHKHIK